MSRNPESPPKGAFDTWTGNLLNLPAEQLVMGKHQRGPTGRFPDAGTSWTLVLQFLPLLLHIPEERLPAQSVREVHESLQELYRAAQEFVGWDQRTSIESFDAPAKLKKLAESFEQLKLRSLPVLAAKHLEPPVAMDISSVERQWKADVLEVVSERLRELTTLRQDLERSARQQAEHQSNVLQEAVKRAAAAQLELAAIKKESDGLLAGIKEAAGSAALTEHAAIYVESESRHLKSGTNWLTGAVVASVSTVAYLAFFLVYWLPNNASQVAATAVEQAVGHLSVLSVCYFAIIFAARNYRAHLHNAAVNRQKADAIKTFRAMADWTKSNATLHSLVIARIADTVFSARATAFTTEDVEVRPPPPLGDLLDTAAKTATQPTRRP